MDKYFSRKLCILKIIYSHAHFQFLWYELWLRRCTGGKSSPYEQKGHTALMRAAEQGHAECARLLIDAGADKNAKANVRRWSLICRDTLLHCFFPTLISSLRRSSSTFSICHTVYMTLSVLHLRVSIYVILVTFFFSCIFIFLSSSSFPRCSRFSLHASLEDAIAYLSTIIFFLEYSHFLMSRVLSALRRRIALTDWVDGAD